MTWPRHRTGGGLARRERSALGTSDLTGPQFPGDGLGTDGAARVLWAVWFDTPLRQTPGRLTTNGGGQAGDWTRVPDGRLFANGVGWGVAAATTLGRGLAV